MIGEHSYGTRSGVGYLITICTSAPSPNARPKELRLDCLHSQLPSSDDYLHADYEHSIGGRIS